MWFRKEVSETHDSPVPDFIFDLINHLDEDVLLIGPGDKPIFSSNGIESLNVLRDSRLLTCLLYTSPSPRDGATSRMPSSA